MKAQSYFCATFKAAFMFSAILLLLRNVSGREIPDSVKIEELKRGESSQQALPSWLENLPDSIPRWMKKAAAKYRGAPHQILCAVEKMSKALKDMKAAKAMNCDNYFRCRGSFDAAQCGVYAATFANHIRYKPEWRTSGMDKHYDGQADLFGSSGGDCLDKYKYKTYGTANECNVPWYYHK